jgi:hypothetical protein
MFTTLVRWSGAEVPNGRVIDGVDQRAVFEGKQEIWNRDGYPFWMGANKGRLVMTVTDGRSSPASILCFGSAKRDLCKNPVVLLAILLEPDAAKRPIALHGNHRHPRSARVQLNHVTRLEL